jgi:creatinine amidohydrolase
MNEVRWERMFPDQLEASFAQCPLVYFTYGICEPHGLHCAVGLDGLKAHAIACEAAKEHGGIVAPPEWWHCHEVGGYAAWAREYVGEVERTWLTSMPPWMHFKTVCYHIRQADALGFRAAILLTGHYGPNWEDLKTLIELIQPHVGTRLCGIPDWEANTPGFDNDGKSGGDHAGKVETSLLWALEPDCIDMSRVPPADSGERPLAMGANCREADRRVGERMVADEVRWLGARGRELLAEYDRVRPRQRLQTFEDVEVLWEDVVRPHLKEFRTMIEVWWDGQKPLPEGSVWAANASIPDRA